MTKKIKLLRPLLATALALSSIAPAIAQQYKCSVDYYCPMIYGIPPNFHIHCNLRVAFLEVLPMRKFLGGPANDWYGQTEANLVINAQISLTHGYFSQNLPINPPKGLCPPPPPPALPNSPRGCEKAGGTWTCSGGPGGKVSRPSCSCEF
jgi:hypothetical protein